MNPLNRKTGNLISKLRTRILILLIFFSPQAFCQTEAEHLYKKGLERQQKGEYQQAIDCYNKALETDSSVVDVFLQRGFCKVAIKDYPGSIVDYTLLISHDPNHVWAYISRGSAKNKMNDFTNAMIDFNKALELEPTNQEAFNNRGFSKKGLGDLKGACEDWNKSKRMGNDEAKIILKNNHCK